MATSLKTKKTTKSKAAAKPKTSAAKKPSSAKAWGPKNSTQAVAATPAPDTDNKKQRLNLDSLLFRIVELIAHHDPRDLTFSRVSRHCNVPRSTLYYYFGKSAEGMLAEAARQGLKLFFGVFEDLPVSANNVDWDTYQRERFNATSDVVRKFPWAPQLYFRYLHDRGAIGDVVRQMQSNYFAAFAERWRVLTGKAPDPLDVKILAAIKVGLLFGIATQKEFDNRRDELTEYVIDLSKPLLSGAHRRK